MPRPQVKRAALASPCGDRERGNPDATCDLVARINHHLGTFVDSTGYFRLYSVAPANRDGSQVCPGVFHGVDEPFTTALEQGSCGAS
jgi:hypothetical protein